MLLVFKQNFNESDKILLDFYTLKEIDECLSLCKLLSRNLLKSCDSMSMVSSLKASIRPMTLPIILSILLLINLILVSEISRDFNYT